MPGDTGGTEDFLSLDEIVLLHSLASCGRGSYRGVKIHLRSADVEEFQPMHAYTLAMSSSATYPLGVVVVHEDRKHAFVFSTTEAI